MSYCSENNTRYDRSRFYTSVGDVIPNPAVRVQVPIFKPGTLAVAEMQIAINRVQPKVGGYDLLIVDGISGSRTQAALSRISSANGGITWTDPDSNTAVINGLAFVQGIPALAVVPVGPFATGDKTAPPAPPAGTPGLPSPGMATSTMIVIAAVGVGVVLAVMKKGRRR